MKHKLYFNLLGFVILLIAVLVFYFLCFIKSFPSQQKTNSIFHQTLRLRYFNCCKIVPGHLLAGLHRGDFDTAN
jgi:hypothetical protein